MRISVPLLSAYHLINHGACPVITTGDGTRRDAAPINWTMPVSDDPFLVAIAVEEGIFTHELIEASGQFAVNVVGDDLTSVVLKLGRTSGREADKFNVLALATAPCKTIKPPRLASAKAHVECEVFEKHSLPGLTLYIGKATHAEIEEECWDGRHVILERLRTIHHIGGGHFAVTDKRLNID